MQIDLEKNVQLINFFAIKEGGKIDYIKVLKLIYLSDKYMLCRHGRMITGDRYAAIKKGPVPSATKDVAEGIVKNSVADEDFPVSKDYCNQYVGHADEWNIESRKDFDDSMFSSAELQAMESVYGKFGSKNKWDLVKLTHEFYEWKKHNIDGKIKKYAPMDIIDFFSSGNDDLNNFFNPDQKDVEVKKDFFLKTNESQCFC